jgi:hypothetical protein
MAMNSMFICWNIFLHVEASECQRVLGVHFVALGHQCLGAFLHVGHVSLRSLALMLNQCTMFMLLNARWKVVNGM